MSSKKARVAGATDAPHSGVPYVEVSESSDGKKRFWVETRYIARCTLPTYSQLAARLSAACAKGRTHEPAKNADVAMLRSLPRELIDRLEAGDAAAQSSVLEYLPYADLWPKRGVADYLRVIVHTFPREYWELARSAPVGLQEALSAHLATGTSLPFTGPSRMLRLLYPLRDRTLSPAAIPEVAEAVQRGSVRLLNRDERRDLSHVTRGVANDPRLALGLASVEDISDAMIRGCLAGAALEYARAIWGIPHRAL